MRYSKQREEILKVVMNSCDHPDANTIYKRTKRIIPNISLGTVYRNLSNLSDNGMILRIPMKDGNDRFDKTISDHNHIRCINCGSVEDISVSIPKDTIITLEKETGFKITDCNFNIKGLCKSCYERKMEEKEHGTKRIKDRK